MYNCHSCGQAIRDAPARSQRHQGVCTCIFCEDCGDVVGDEMESTEWNLQQLKDHKILDCRQVIL